MKDKLQKILDERMKKGRKKGFTLVELLVVIAIIAVLATVSVIGYLGFTKRANVSNDTSLVAQLNTVMQGDEAVNGKSDTPSEALEAVKEAGYDVTKLTPTTSDYDIIWNQETNLFALLDENGSAVYGEANAVAYKNWTFLDAYPESTNYSVYLNPGYTGETTISVTTGIDVGENDNIDTITYTDSSEEGKNGLRFNLNGGDLTVNAPNSTLSVYGDTYILNVENASDNSVYIRGDVGLLSLTDGRVVLTDNSSVNTLFITKNTAGNAYAGSIIASTANASLPKSIRRETISSLASDSVITTIQSLDSSGNVSTSEEIRYVSEGSVKAYKDNAEISSGSASKLAIQLLEEANTGSSAEDINNGYSLFAGGTGTENNPYIIVDFDSFQNISKYYSKGTNYFEVKEGIEEIDCEGWSPIYLNGCLNGNGVTLTKLTSVLIYEAQNGSDGVCKIENFNLQCDIISTTNASSLIYAAHHLYVENVNVSGRIIGTEVGGYVVFGGGWFEDANSAVWQPTFKNCVNTAELVAYSGSISGFVKHPYCDMSQINTSTAYNNTQSYIEVIDSAFTGKMSATGSMNYFSVNGEYIRVKESYSDAFLSSESGIGVNPNGVLHAELTADSNGFSNCGASTKKSSYRPNDGKEGGETYTSKLTNNTGTLPENKGDVFTTTKINDATRAMAIFTISPNAAGTETGSYTATYKPSEDNLSLSDDGNSFVTTELKYWDIEINKEGVESTGLIEGTNTYNVYNTFYGKTHNGAYVYVLQFDSNGSVVGITKYQVATSNAVSFHDTSYNVLFRGKIGAESWEYNPGIGSLSGEEIQLSIYGYNSDKNFVEFENTSDMTLTIKEDSIVINNVAEKWKDSLGYYVYYIISGL